MKTISETCFSRYPKSLLRADPVASLASYARTANDTFLFAGELLSEVPRYRLLFEDAVGKDLKSWKLYFPTAQDCEFFKNSNFDDLIDYLNGDGYSTAVYVADAEEKIVCYSNNRDSFSFCLANCRVDPELIERWDSDFAGHLKTVGIGFGTEGRQYIASILEGLAKDDPAFKRRCTRILSGLNPFDSGR